MPRLDTLPLDDRIFALLALTILGLFLTAVLFSFLTIQLRAINTRKNRLRAGQEAKWDPVILEVLAGTQDPESLTRLVSPGEELPFLDYLLHYFRRIRGQETAILKVLAEPFLPLLAERMRKGSVERRARSVQTLGVLGMPEYVRVVRDALDDPSPLVSMIAAQSLTEPGYPEFLAPVLQQLPRYSDWHPAFLAGLLSDAGAEAAPLLRTALGDGGRPGWERAIVAQALRNIRDLDAADVAAEVLEGTEDPDLLVPCLRLVAELGEGRHLDALIPHLESPHFPVRSYALRALRTFSVSDDLPIFLKALDDESPWVAMEAARGMRDLGALAPLQELAHSDGPRSALALQVMSE